MVERCPKCGSDGFVDAHYFERHVTDGIQCLRNQLVQAQELFKKAVESCCDAFCPIGDVIGLQLGESFTDDAPGKAAEWIKQARERIAELERQQQSTPWQLQRIEELAKERDALQAKLDEVLSQRMSEAEAKLGTRPAEVVVGELEDENRRLREALRVIAWLKPSTPALFIDKDTPERLARHALEGGNVKELAEWMEIEAYAGGEVQGGE